jgi:hypothetical protein
MSISNEPYAEKHLTVGSNNPPHESTSTAATHSICGNNPLQQVTTNKAASKRRLCPDNEIHTAMTELRPRQSFGPEEIRLYQAFVAVALTVNTELTATTPWPSGLVPEASQCAAVV